MLIECLFPRGDKFSEKTGMKFNLQPYTNCDILQVFPKLSNKTL